MGAKMKSFNGIYVLVSTLCLAASAVAQGTTSLRGVVTDQQKAVIPQATVTLAGQENGVTRTFQTGQNGEYQFLQIPPGVYNVQAAMSGFADRKVEGLHLLVDTPATLDLTLTVAASTQNV